ncbi:MAG: phosphate ABC transporter permease PstA [Chloroflexi bacterium]|nr:phosphate ABC transporter permease PstA [Chloroflexota bacterium]
MPARDATLAERLRAGRSPRRRAVDRAGRGLALAATLACVVPLAAVLFFVVAKGAGALNLDLLTKPAKALGTGGGALQSWLGTVQMVGLATLIAVPVGIAAGIYVSEFAGHRAARAIRFASDVMVGVPSILVGIFVYVLLVLPFRQFNAFAGSVALAVIIVPVIQRTTEEVLGLVPRELREGSLALGVPSWRTTLSVVLPTARAGVLTGVMLGVARAAGETAPLLFTALGSRLVNIGGFGEPMDSLTLFIYNGARSPIAALNDQAWGAALLLLLLVLGINVSVRLRSMGGVRA